jgi:hypothetical protein
VRYDTPVKAKQSQPDEYTRFQNALRQVLSVSKSDLSQMLADDEKSRRQHKAKPGPKPKRSRASASGHASDDKS